MTGELDGIDLGALSPRQREELARAADRARAAAVARGENRIASALADDVALLRGAR